MTRGGASGGTNGLRLSRRGIAKPKKMPKANGSSFACSPFFLLFFRSLHNRTTQKEGPISRSPSCWRIMWLLARLANMLLLTLGSEGGKACAMGLHWRPTHSRPPLLSFFFLPVSSRTPRHAMRRWLPASGRPCDRAPSVGRPGTPQSSYMYTPRPPSYINKSASCPLLLGTPPSLCPTGAGR